MKYLEDFKVGDIDRFGSYVMSKDDVIAYAKQFDPQPFHLDDEAGAAHPLFKGLTASGWHTGAATMRMLVDRNSEVEVAALGSPGIEQISWPTPTYPGDTLSVQVEVLEVRPSKSRPEIGFVKNRTTTLNQNGKEVMIFTASVILKKRPAG